MNTRLLEKLHHGLVQMGGLLMWAGPLTATAQDNINFQDLARPGPPVVKPYIVPGLAADGRRYLEKFDGVDTARIEARRAALAAAPSTGSTSSSSGSSSARPQGPQTGNYVCTFSCSTVNIIASNQRSPTNTISVSATSESEASDRGLPMAKSVCWDNYKMVPYQPWGNRVVQCKKR